MFERENLQNNEQFIELKQAFLVPVAAYQHPLAQLKQVSFDDIFTARQIVIASRDRQLKPELLFSKHYWRTDHHHAACALILKNLGWGVLPLEMLKQNPQLEAQLKILNIVDFSPKFDYYVDLVWNREHALGAAAQYLIQYVRQQRVD